MYAYILEVVLSKLANRDAAVLARAIREHVVMRWVPPDDADPS
jgi:hypothetical protein